MPLMWVDPEPFLRRRGATVYRIYIEDRVDKGPRTWWFGWTPNARDGNGDFDVRELPTWPAAGGDINKALCLYIDMVIDQELPRPWAEGR